VERQVDFPFPFGKEKFPRPLLTNNGERAQGVPNTFSKYFPDWKHKYDETGLCNKKKERRHNWLVVIGPHKENYKIKIKEKRKQFSVFIMPFRTCVQEI